MQIGSRLSQWLKGGVPPPPGPVVYPAADPSQNVTNIQTALDGLNPGEAVYLVDGDYQINTQLNLNNNVMLIGAGMDSTSLVQVSPSTTNATRCVKLDGGSSVVGMTLTKGHTTDGGAGALVKNGTVSWCRVCDSIVSNGSQSGAGISFTDGHGFVDHCIVYGNKLGNSSWGAGLGGKTPNGDIVIDCCLIYSNDNPSGSGGGIGIDEPNNITITIRNTTITRNFGNFNTGGIYIHNGNNTKVILVNDILTNNWLQNSSNEVNAMIKTGYLDENASSNCLITGTAADFGSAAIKDATLKTKIRNTVDADPKFVDVESDDYHLMSDSPAKNMGITVLDIDKDLDNKSYSVPPSIGCYEV